MTTAKDEFAAKESIRKMFLMQARERHRKHARKYDTYETTIGDDDTEICVAYTFESGCKTSYWEPGYGDSIEIVEVWRLDDETEIQLDPETESWVVEAALQDHYKMGKCDRSED